MDSLIYRFDSVPDKDLVFCHHRGVAYQADMTNIIPYDQDYFDKCASYDAEICSKVIEGRISLVNRYCPGPVLDIGVGSGDFVRSRHNTRGFDVNKYAVAWLKEHNLYSDNIRSYDAITLWDVLEHIDAPNIYLRKIPRDGHLFISLPIFNDLNDIRQSKHYRPGEHLYYWTAEGFISWMALYNFRLLETSAHEMEAGREDILAFVFKRDLPDYQEFVGMYYDIHMARHYGASSNLYLDQIGEVVRKLNPSSILDYGCGRSDLVAHFWRDGKRVIKRYDPAINEFKEMPGGEFDLVLCCDVMEHIPMRHVDRVFKDIRLKSQRVIFVISQKPARAKLPNGDNAHVTLLSTTEWIRWIDEIFGKAVLVPTKWENTLMVKTFP